MQRAQEAVVALAMVLDDADRARQRGLAPRVELREQGVERVYFERLQPALGTSA
jgi:hypothetical protein